MVIRQKRSDDDWKRRAEEEKEKIEAAMRAEQERSNPQPAAPSNEGAAGPDAASGSRDRPSSTPQAAPPAGLSFLDLVRPLAMQALAGLGQMPDPATGMRGVDLEFARDHIELLGVLEQKTRGNLTPEEKATLDQMLRELRTLFASLASRAAMSAMPPHGPPHGTPR